MGTGVLSSISVTSSAPLPRCSSHTPGPAASGSAVIAVAASGSAHTAPVIGAEPEGANTCEATFVKPNDAGDAVHGISTSGSPAAEGVGAAPAQCRVTVSPYAWACASATTCSVATDSVNSITISAGGVAVAAAASGPVAAPVTAWAAGASDTVSVSADPAGASYTPFANVNGWVPTSVPPVIVNPVNAPASKAVPSRPARNHTLPAPSSSSLGGGGGNGGCRIGGLISSRTGTTANGAAAPANWTGADTVIGNRSTQCRAPVASWNGP